MMVDYLVDYLVEMMVEMLVGNSEKTMDVRLALK